MKVQNKKTHSKINGSEVNLQKFLVEGYKDLTN